MTNTDALIAACRAALAQALTLSRSGLWTVEETRTDATRRCVAVLNGSAR